MQKSFVNQIHRPNAAILDDLRQALWEEETIRSIDAHHISIAVEYGQVCISGHISKANNKQRIEEISRAVSGVLAVHNHLVTDHEICIQVSRALSDDERAHLYSIPVDCCHGWVELGGSVPNREMQLAVEAVASSVPTVRGVILLPNIEGEHSASIRYAVQPRIGVSVFGKDETIGKVHQVVITPQNRLVTHAIVRINVVTNCSQEPHDILIPVEAMHLVDEGGITINHSTIEIQRFPSFTPADYPLAPLTWQPPFPYEVGSVRQPRLEKANRK